MRCPLCLDQHLEPNHRMGIEIDICPQCRGVWLDRGELDRFAASSPPTDPWQVDAGGDDRLPSAPAGRPAPRRDRFEDDDDDAWDAGFDDRRDDDRDRDRPKKSKKRKKGLAHRLGDLMEEVLDL